MKGKIKSLRESYEEREKNLRSEYNRKMKENEREFKEFQQKLIEKDKNLMMRHQSDLRRIREETENLERQISEFGRHKLLTRQTSSSTLTSRFGDHFKKKFLS